MQSCSVQFRPADGIEKREMLSDTLGRTKYGEKATVATSDDIVEYMDKARVRSMCVVGNSNGKHHLLIIVALFRRLKAAIRRIAGSGEVGEVGEVNTTLREKRERPT